MNNFCYRWTYRNLLQKNKCGRPKSGWDNILAMEAKKQQKNEQKVVDFYTFFKAANICVHVTQSNSYSYDPSDEILNIDQSKYFFDTNPNNKTPEWIQFDFEDYLVNLTEYTVVNAYKNWRLYNWNIEGSTDGFNWHVLCAHRNDGSVIKLASDTAQFVVPENKEFDRYIRLITSEWSYFNDGCDRQTTTKKSCAFTLKALQLKGSVKKR